MIIRQYSDYAQNCSSTNEIIMFFYLIYCLAILFLDEFQLGEKKN